MRMAVVVVGVRRVRGQGAAAAELGFVGVALSTQVVFEGGRGGGRCSGRGGGQLLWRTLATHHKESDAKSKFEHWKTGYAWCKTPSVLNAALPTRNRRLAAVRVTFSKTSSSV